MKEGNITNLYLIRHGQASFGEKNYDNLSKKGVKQSIALGKKLLKNNIYFDQTIIGPLNRHQQTFDGINQGYGGDLSDPLIIEEFAENQLMEIAQHFIPKMLNTDKNIKEIFNAVPFWKRKRKFLEHFNIIAKKWIHNELDLSEKGFESYDAFRERVRAAKSKVFSLMNENTNTMVVSSGGAITGVYAECHPLTVDEIMKLNFKIKNASITLFKKENDTFTLDTFNRSLIPRYLETYI
ncbi:MAG: histidine phosphatase family protein [Candidatus Neomarinimicrobiota bacterium]